MKSTNTTVEPRIDALLAEMTLDEKVALLSGRDAWHTVPIERLGIQPLAMTDGPHGVRANRTGPERVQGTATSFPTGVSMAATWDPDLIERVGVALAEETRALGCDLLLGPCVNIVRTPLAGRNFETYSEDPYLAGRIGVAFVKGVQSRTVGTSLKHYACNNQEYERRRGSSEIDERTLREIYLPAFEAVVKETQPWTVMCAYNRINGVYASQHHYLLTEILRDEWGFEGAVISDWGANHTVVDSVAGGLDLEMPGPAMYYGRLLERAVQLWQIDEAVVDQAVRRMLRLLARAGKVERLQDKAMPLSEGAVNTPEHQALAREVAEASITLLKNDDDVLPLDKDTLTTIAVIGPNAAEARIGGGGSSYLEPPYRVSPLDGLKAKLGDHVKLEYALGCDNDPDQSVNDAENEIAKAVELAKRADIVLIFAGMPRGYESEGHDRPTMDLPGPQTELIKEVAGVNVRTIVVINCGAPITMPWLNDVSAVLLAFYPGQEGGHALADILLGDVNPSGKLSITLPQCYADNPTYLNYPGQRKVYYGEGIFVGYRYYDYKDVEPMFPFGFGLSYTTFAYSDLEVPTPVRASKPVEVAITIKNTGKRAGKEVVQVYVHDKQASVVRPPKELKGFQKVHLEPGASQTLHFTLNERAFSFYDPDKRQWVAEPGEYEILVGSSSRDIRARATLTLKE